MCSIPLFSDLLLVLTDQSSASWEGPFALTDEKEEEEEQELCEEEEDEEDERKSNEAVKRSRREEAVTSSAPPEIPVCAKNISLTASGEKVILWTRYCLTFTALAKQCFTNVS